MKGALEEFETMLVHASRALHEAASAAPGEPARPKRGRMRRLRQLGLFAQVAFAVTSFSALGGAATGAYLWLTSNSPGTRALPQFECSIAIQGRVTGATLGVSSVTGDPLIDCAAALTQAQGRPAPRLVAWGNGFQTAVVRRAGSGPPSGAGAWRQLPAGWTVDLPVVELNDQLNDISAGMADGMDCTYASRAKRVARALLVADGLHGWRVALHANNGPLVQGCRQIAPNVDAPERTIELIQIQELGRPTHVTPLQHRRQHEYASALASLLRLQAHANRSLGERCATVTQAASLWQREARLSAFVLATPAFWREVRALGETDRSGPPRLPRGFFRHYTLFRQPPSQPTGACAHLLVQDDGGDQLIVYAARMAP
jgi:hypothetical protein